MCATCGCEGDAKTTMLNLQTGAETAISGGHRQPREHVHADGTRHTHPLALSGSHSHGHGSSGRETLVLEDRILAKNDALAGRNRTWLSDRQILAVNLVSSPGSGKTTLLERTIPGLTDEVPAHRRDRRRSGGGRR